LTKFKYFFFGLFTTPALWLNVLLRMALHPNETPIKKIHSNSKFQVSATEGFRKTTFTEFKKCTRNFRFSNRNFEFSNRNFGFSNRNFGFFNRNFVFLKTEVVCCKDFFCPTETSGVDAGIFSNPYEVSNEICVERKPEKFS
jgi:hypothetical protein